MKIKILSLLMTVTLSSNLLAGFKVGNGGDAVVCFDDSLDKNDLSEFKADLNKGIVTFSHPYFDMITSVELLDLYEHPLKSGKNSEFFFEENEITDGHYLLRKIEAKIRYTHPKLALRFYKARKKLLFVIDNMNVLNEIHDEGEVPTLTDDCLLIQLAEQSYYNSYVAMNGKLFHLLSKRSRSLLYLHEVIFNLFIENNSGKYQSLDGDRVRETVRYLISQNFMEEQKNYEIDITLKKLGLE